MESKEIYNFNKYCDLVIKSHLDYKKLYTNEVNSKSDLIADFCIKNNIPVIKHYLKK